jgi:subtilisin family serine protease
MAFYLDCLQFMLAPFPLDGDPFLDGDPLRGADILNNSWGCPDLEGCEADSMLPAVTALRHAGIFVVVSAGNDGPDCSTVNSPLALYDQVLSVGAIDRLGNVTSFSSRGPVTADGSNRIKPDLVAPGLEILSAFPGNRYRRWQGTSMAGPHVAGVVALMWSANPQLVGDIDRTERILTGTAQPLPETAPTCDGGDGLPNNVFGYGMVDAYAAVREALSLQGN